VRGQNIAVLRQNGGMGVAKNDRGGGVCQKGFAEQNRREFTSRGGGLFFVMTVRQHGGELLGNLRGG